jgi:hypothetical protein
MGQLHEILAVEGGLEKTSKKLVQSSMKQFGKENLFTGQTRILTMFDADQSQLNTTETQKIETTVDENLDYALKGVAKYWDSIVQKDEANQRAVADINVNGNVIAKDVPATTLLGLESKLVELRNLFEAIPTLAPGITWVKSEGDIPGVFVTKDPVIQFKTENDIDYRVLYEATKEHPAQVTQFKVVKNVGKYTTEKKSGMYSSHRKAQVLENLETLLAAVKRARQRANKVEVNKEKAIGNALIDFIRNN